MKKRGKGQGGPKIPKQAVATSGGKQPKEKPVDEGGDLISWRFRQCDGGGPFAWDWDGFTKHLDKIHHFESKPWPAVEMTGTIGAKRIPLDNLSSDAKKRLKAIGHDDAEALVELRVGGAPRFWGFRVGHCLHFLWWDPEHEVCPTKK